jgi:hypothetical protein
MSTRCQIGFYDESAAGLKDWTGLVYRHSDGYPGKVDGSEYGVLADIVPFLKTFPRKGDAEYTGARLLQYLCNEYDKGGYDKYETEKTGHKGGVLGHGISKEWHADLEYYYAVYKDRVEVYEVNYVWNTPGGIAPEPRDWSLRVPEFKKKKTVKI